jgi:hypothetical protein
MMGFLYYDNVGRLWVWFVMGITLLVSWALVSWAVVSIIRHRKDHRDRGSQTSPRTGSALLWMMGTPIDETSSKETAKRQDPSDMSRPNHCSIEAAQAPVVSRPRSLPCLTSKHGWQPATVLRDHQHPRHTSKSAPGTWSVRFPVGNTGGRAGPRRPHSVEALQS